MKILVVDDSKIVQRGLIRLFDVVDGVEIVGCARDVTGALSLIELLRPDLVVLDVNLLDGDRGIDVLRYVKRHHPQMQVVGLSNVASPPLRDAYLEAGATAFFDKANQFLELRDWIARQCAATRSRDSEDSCR